MTLVSTSTITARPVRDRRSTVRRVLIATIVVLLVAMAAATVYIALFCTEPVPGFHELRLWTVLVAAVLGLAAASLRPRRRD